MATAWFRPKRYGYGATPINWQGWTFLLGFDVGFVLFNHLWRHMLNAGIGHILILAGIDVAVVAGAVAIARRKTEGGWRWRWGDQD